MVGSGDYPSRTIKLGGILKYNVICIVVVLPY